jgi:AcrR family transcriptional regulator
VRTPQTARAQATHDALLQATARILLREGLDAVTTNRVAEVAGVSIGSLYQYFPDKQSLLDTLALGLVERRLDRIRGALLSSGGLEPEVLLSRVVDSLFDVDRPDDARLESMLIPVLAGQPGAGRKALGRSDELLQPLVEVALGMRFPARRATARVAAFLLIHAVRGNVLGVALTPSMRPRLPELKRELVRMLLGYLEGD